MTSASTNQASTTEAAVVCGGSTEDPAHHNGAFFPSFMLSGGRWVDAHLLCDLLIRQAIAENYQGQPDMQQLLSVVNNTRQHQ